MNNNSFSKHANQSVNFEFTTRLKPQVRYIRTRRLNKRRSGVSYDEYSHRWKAKLRFQGYLVYNQSFYTRADAERARREMIAKFFS
ncbi:hypothetical protein ABTQ33_04760 [Paucilactobacillus suebicus]|uniref:hypothetical protein n=1 Tax=Paucilactobacillus suebicus TaxID=152335 RepID=UPI0002490241|nr:hypothetical protein [Paucilactobacillus suebicus]